jgi:hypothetical protein
MVWIHQIRPCKMHKRTAGYTKETRTTNGYKLQDSDRKRKAQSYHKNLKKPHNIRTLMITIQKVTNNVQSVPRQSPDIY